MLGYAVKFCTVTRLYCDADLIMVIYLFIYLLIYFFFFLFCSVVLPLRLGALPTYSSELITQAVSLSERQNLKNTKAGNYASGT